SASYGTRTWWGARMSSLASTAVSQPSLARLLWCRRLPGRSSVLWRRGPASPARSCGPAAPERPITTLAPHYRQPIRTARRPVAPDGQREELWTGSGRSSGHPIRTPRCPGHDMFGALNGDTCAQDFLKDLELFAAQARTRHGRGADGTVLFQQD